MVGSNFFLQKPNFRQISSQVPYIEKLPNQFTVDYSNQEDLKNVLHKALSGSLSIFKNTSKICFPFLSNIYSADYTESKIPFEFTGQSMISRLEKIFDWSRQDYCLGSLKKPLLSKIPYVVIARSTESNCDRTCKNLKMVCSPDHFQLINTEPYLRQNTRKNFLFALVLY